MSIFETCPFYKDVRLRHLFILERGLPLEVSVFERCLSFREVHLREMRNVLSIKMLIYIVRKCPFSRSVRFSWGFNDIFGIKLMLFLYCKVAHFQLWNYSLKIHWKWQSMCQTLFCFSYFSVWLWKWFCNIIECDISDFLILGFKLTQIHLMPNPSNLQSLQTLLAKKDS